MIYFLLYIFGSSNTNNPPLFSEHFSIVLNLMFVGIVYQINHVPSGALISHHPRADIPVNTLRELLSKAFPSTCRALSVQVPAP